MLSNPSQLSRIGIPEVHHISVEKNVGISGLLHSLVPLVDAHVQQRRAQESQAPLSQGTPVPLSGLDVAGDVDDDSQEENGDSHAPRGGPNEEDWTLIEKQDEAQAPLRLVVVGRQNVGKVWRGRCSTSPLTHCAVLLHSSAHAKAQHPHCPGIATLFD